MNLRFFPILLLLFLYSNLYAQSVANPNTGFNPKMVFEKYCLDCHDQDSLKGNINFELLLNNFRDEKIKEQWVKTWDVLKNDLMPPPHKKQLAQDDKVAVIQWIQKEAFAYDPQKPDPGKAVIRRLNREEYNNTINDLFLLETNIKDGFPPDDTGFGFDNIGSVLTMSPILTEKYIQAADHVLERAMPYDNPESYEFNIPVHLFKGNTYPIGGGIALISNDVVSYQDEIIYAGEYEYAVTVSGQQAGPDLVKMNAGIKGVSIEEFTIQSDRGNKETHKVKVKLKQGNQPLQIAFLNDYYDPKNPDPKQRDRNLEIYSIKRTGPFQPEKTQTSAFENKWLSGVNEVKTPMPFVKMFLTNFLPRAYRRDVKTDEIESKIKLFNVAFAETKSIRESIRWVLRSVLISPHFLFRDESMLRPDSQVGVYQISEFALASKLSYFLWSSMPDEKLLQLASARLLRRNLNDEIKRMLKSPKVKNFADNFTGQWLQLRNLELKTPSFAAYPTYSKILMHDAKRETEEYINHIISQDRSILELLDSDYTFLNQRLANHYEIAGVQGNEFRKVILKDKRRGGLLTQTSILTITSYPTRTSLVLRGKYILENLLGYTPPSPPPDMPSLADKEETKEKTLRERIQLHAANETCAACHSKFDPMGYALENYDGIGKWRTNDNGKPLDTKGKLLSGESFDGAVELKEVLLSTKKDLFTKCMVKKLMVYALGRGLQYYDEVEVDQIAQHTAKQNYVFSEMIIAIVNSTPFQKQRGKNE